MSGLGAHYLPHYNSTRPPPSRNDIKLRGVAAKRF
jgi:hypothetical protein